MSETDSTPITDLLSSIVFGAVFGAVVYFLGKETGLIDTVAEQVGLLPLGGRLGLTEFAALGAVFGVMLDLLGKICWARYGSRLLGSPLV